MKTYISENDGTFTEIENGKIIRTNLKGEDISEFNVYDGCFEFRNIKIDKESLNNLKYIGKILKENIEIKITDGIKITGDIYFTNPICIYNQITNGEKLSRGKRRLLNLCEESAGDLELPNYMEYFSVQDKNNLYLNKKERDSIKIKIEQALHSFECEVDSYLRNNELQLAKDNHKVVDTCRSILNKLEIADFEEIM
jgi:hypothetical protein